MRAISLRRKTLFLVLACLVWLGVAQPSSGLPGERFAFQEAAIQPQELSLELNSGESTQQQISVTTAPTPIPKVDVLFLFDVTGSMGDELDQAKERGKFIMDSLIAQVPDAAFGVASFADYPGSYDYAGYIADYGQVTDYPWSLDVDISSDTTQVQSGIESLFLQNGEDLPEAYTRALYESLFVGWRPGAKRVIVLFGDAPAHDPNFYQSFAGGENFGVDPGRDAVAGTADDLGFTETIDQVSDAGIQVLPISSQTADYEFVLSGFEYIANETGGQVYSLSRADDLPELVASGLEQATSNISSLTISPDNAYADWVVVDPPSWNDVGGGETRQFDVTIAPPAGAAAGPHTFDLQVTGDAALLGATTVNVTIGSSLLDPAAIRAEKYQLIEQLSAPAFTTEFLGTPTNWTPAAAQTYAVQEQEVRAWLDTLDWTNLSPSEMDAAYRLTSQERALLDLLNAQVEVSQLGNNQLGHVSGIIWSALAASDKLDASTEDAGPNAVADRLQQQAQLKLLQELTTASQWSAALLPPNDPLTASFQTEVNKIGETFGAKLAEAEASGPLAVDAYRGLLLTELILPMNQLNNALYVSQTRDLLSQGLANAQEIASSPSPTDAGEQALQIDEQINADITSYQGHVETLQNSYQASDFDNRALQDMTALTNLLAGAMTDGQLSPQELENLIQLANDVTDDYYATPEGYSAYGTWWSAADVAGEVSDTAFVPPASSVALLQMLARHQGKEIPGLSKHATIPDLSDFDVALVAQVDEDAGSYTEILNQLEELVNKGDDEGILGLLEDLFSADDNLNQSIQAANLPVVTGSRNVFAASSSEFAPVYSDFGRSTSAFNSANAGFYVSLLDLLNRPADPAEQQRVLEQITAVKGTMDAYRTNIATTLPYVEATAAQPMVLISDFNMPELQLGVEAQVELTLWNPSPNSAEGVTITFDPGSDAQATTASPVAVGLLNSESTTRANISFVPNAESGFLTLTTDAGNGVGSTRIIPFSANRTQEPVPPRPTGIGPWTWLIIGIATVLVLGLMLFTRRTT